MRLVVQRVREASVAIDGRTVAAIGRGLLILCGAARGDTEEDAIWLAGKTARLRIFEDDAGKMNLDITAIRGEALVVSQFTLFGDCRKGNRPSFMEAADPAEGERLYEHYVAALRVNGLPVQTGVFRAMMHVALVNDGPVTLILDSRERAARNGGAE